MIIDHLLEFTKTSGQVLSAAAASDYRIDFTQSKPTTGLDYGDLVAVFTVKEDVTGTLTPTLQHCDTETGTYEALATGSTLSAPTAGTQVAIPIPRHHKRYVQAYFGGAPTAGTVHAFISSGMQDNEPPEIAESLMS